MRGRRKPGSRRRHAAWNPSGTRCARTADSDGRGVGFYFRNVTEFCLFGVRGKNARTLAPGRRQVNLVGTRKREHSRKPDEFYDVIEACSPAERLEIFARGARPGRTAWGHQAEDYEIGWDTYAHNSRSGGERDWAEAAE